MREREGGEMDMCASMCVCVLRKADMRCCCLFREGGRMEAARDDAVDRDETETERHTVAVDRNDGDRDSERDRVLQRQ